MKSIKVCEYSRSRSFHDDLILQDQASGERSQHQWSCSLNYFTGIVTWYRALHNYGDGVYIMDMTSNVNKSLSKSIEMQFLFVFISKRA